MCLFNQDTNKTYSRALPSELLPLVTSGMVESNHRQRVLNIYDFAVRIFNQFVYLNANSVNY